MSLFSAQTLPRVAEYETDENDGFFRRISLFFAEQKTFGISFWNIPSQRKGSESRFGLEKREQSLVSDQLFITLRRDEN